MRNLLAGPGEPETIVAAAGPVHPVRPILGWFLSLVLLWTSAARTTRQTLFGTLVVPGGLATPLILGLLASPVVLPAWIAIPLAEALIAELLVAATVLLRSASRPAA